MNHLQELLEIYRKVVHLSPEDAWPGLSRRYTESVVAVSDDFTNGPLEVIRWRYRLYEAGYRDVVKRISDKWTLTRIETGRRLFVVAR